MYELDVYVLHSPSIVATTNLRVIIVSNFPNPPPTKSMSSHNLSFLPTTIRAHRPLGCNKFLKIPKRIQLIWITHQHPTLLRNLRNLHPIQRPTIPVKQNPQTILQQRTCLTLLHIRPVLLAHERQGNVPSETRGEDIILVRRANLIHHTQEGGVARGTIGVLLESRHHHIVPQWIHLVTTIVHDRPQITPYLLGAFLVIVLFVQ
mmetsp:Transcript_22568/g.40386  ORF Transcript_22568/g.40386 Transcript_22568/m.40386 type:complete len:205 (-) Transcript_22568:471-1085(-)